MIVHRRASVLALLTLVLLAGCASDQPANPPVRAPEKEAPKKADPSSLYSRLGGVYAIAAVVDDFTERLLVNQVVLANPVVGKMANPARKAGLKFHVTAQVCEATGGPERYTGKTMKESHKEMGVTEKEWDAAVADLKATLAKFKVPEKEQGELIAIVATLKPDIVVPAAAPKGAPAKN